MTEIRRMNTVQKTGHNTLNQQQADSFSIV